MTAGDGYHSPHYDDSDDISVGSRNSEERKRNKEEDELIDSVMLESNDFDYSSNDDAIQERQNKIMNKHLSKLEIEIFNSIKYGDHHKLMDMGISDVVDLNFKIEIEKDVFYAPVMLAAALGQDKCLKVILQNRMVDINVQDEKTGTNSFWVAAYYGRGMCMSILALNGINILNTHKYTQTNALHVAIERKHWEVARMLIDSKYPLDERKNGGLTPLILCARNNDKEANQISEQLVKKGSD